jgi:hypothetical protein
MHPAEQIDARLARYATTFDARDLWPDVTVGAFHLAQAEMARVTAAVLADGPRPIELQLPPDTDARALGVAASAAGMGPLLGFWREAGRIAASPAVTDLLATHLDHGRRRAARMDRELERLLVPLVAGGMEVFLLKGTYTAHRYFPEPGVRPTADIDLLVRPEHASAARRILRDLGFVEPAPTAAPSSHWTPPQPQVARSLELAHADNPWSVDLHVSLDRSPCGGVTTALGLPERSGGEVWRAFSRPLRVLPQPLLLAYLALHTSSHFYTITLVRLVELVLVVRRDFAGRPERWRAFSDLVRGTATGRFVFPAMHLAERLAPGTVDPLVLEQLVAAAPRRLRRLVQATTPASAQRLHPRPMGAVFIWVTSWREVFASLAELAWPRDGDRLVPARQVVSLQGRRIRRICRRIQTHLGR